MPSAPELLSILLAAALASLALLRAARPAGRARWLLLLALFLPAAAAAPSRLPRPASPPDPARPRPTPPGEYLSSSACRSCHPAEHASFSRTFHRTMTQDATPASVLAPADGAPLLLDGRVHRLERRGDRILATLPDPDAVADAARLGKPTPDAGTAPDVTRPLVLTTGSHHEQAYWVAGGRSGELRLFPFVWLIADKRWVPRRDAFLQPPDAPPHAIRWNSNCIACHAVSGRPGHDPDRDAFNTRAVELGISCEACHGPGGAHARRHRDPVERYLAHSAHDTPDRPGGDPTIINPARLPPDRSAAVCGQCHSYAYPRDEDDWWSNGYALSFRPGQDLSPSRSLLTPAALARDGAPRVEAASESLFWDDGVIRVGGREYNALVDSPCYARGKGEHQMTCLSCHSMHAGDPDDQLAPDRRNDQACLSCHSDKQTSDHTHHALPDAPGIAPSAGSSCVNCHMPYTTYALFKAIRSHRIEAPSVSATLGSGRPNACNLCHLDRSLAWTQRYLEQWYGAPHVDLEGDHARLAAGAVDALRGDAAQRILAAAALGWAPALAASGQDFQPLLLAELLVDPYSAVRFVAARSLRALPGYQDLPYDFLAPAEDRARARAAVRERFAQHPRPSTRAPAERAALALTADGAPDDEALRALLARRDTRAITIAE